MNKFEDITYDKSTTYSIWKKIMLYTYDCKKEVVLSIICLVALIGTSSIFPLLLKYAIDTFIQDKKIEQLIPFIIVALILVIIVYAGVYYFVIFAGAVEQAIKKNLRESAFKNLQELSFSYFDKTAVGWIMSRMVSDVSKVGGFLAFNLPDILWSPLIVTFYIIIMFALNPYIALIILVTIPIVFILGFYCKKIILREYRIVKKLNSGIVAKFNEGLQGAKTTKTLVREEENLKEFKDDSQSLKRTRIKVAIWGSVFPNSVTIISAICTSIVLIRGTSEILNGNITVGTLSAFIMYIGLMFEPIIMFANLLANLQDATTSAERILSLIETQPSITDSQEIIKKYGTYMDPNYENFEPIKGDIEFQNVDFTYGSTENVITNFNLKIEAGKQVAIVGETGAGKSTIVNMICRFYEPTGGKILIDGVDYKERSQYWLHSNISYVLQTPHLFSGTIMENIRYGKLTATDEEVIEAAKKVDAYDFVMNFPDGFDTQVGEGGGKLSQGERQLISFARAIIGDPRIFILDEATSSIDTLSEKKIQKAIDVSLKNRTSFIVAHRLSTIINADIILVMENGKIIEQGNFEELMKLNSEFAKLYNANKADNDMNSL